MTNTSTGESLALSSLNRIFGVVRLIKSFQKLNIKPPQPARSYKADAKLSHELLTDIEVESIVFN